MSITLGDTIASLVISQFNKLPAKSKPVLRSNGVQEWTVLAGIVVEKANGMSMGLCGDLSGVDPKLLNVEARPFSLTNSTFHCISIATGVKSVPDTIVSKCHGRVLHDMHAEILCLRAFNKFILHECHKLMADEGFVSHVVKKRENGMCGQKDCLPATKKPRLETSKESKTAGGYLFEAQPGIKIHLYISDAPCGDASLSNTVKLAGPDYKEWTEAIKPIGTGEGASKVDCAPTSEQVPSNFMPKTSPLISGPLRGRDHFTSVGHVRTKPGRRDSPLTLSKSCSDKLAMRVGTGILAGPVARLVSPKGFYLSSLTVPETQFDSKDFERAFGKTGRLQSLVNGQKNQSKCGLDKREMNDTDNKPEFGEYSINFFDFLTTKVGFEYERDPEKKPSPISMIQVSDGIGLGVKKTTAGSMEIINNGVKQGNKVLSGRGMSQVSRLEIYKKIADILGTKRDTSREMDIFRVEQERLTLQVKHESYLGFKGKDKNRNEVKTAMKESLKGWVSTAKDDFEI